MNYGKLAYQQLGDMDARLLRLESRGGGAYRSAGFTANVGAVAAGRYDLPPLVLELPRATPVYVELTLMGSVPAAASVRLELLLSGSVLDAAELSLAAGGFTVERRYNVAELSPGAYALTVRVTPAGGEARLDTMTITAFGTDIAESADTCRMAADGLTAACVAVSGESDTVTLTLGDVKKRVCGARDFDVCFIGADTVMLAVVNGRGELRLSSLSAADLTERYVAALDAGVTQASLAAQTGAFPLLVCYVKRGSVYLARAAEGAAGLCVTAGEKQDYKLATVASVSVVKSHPASPAVLAATGGGVCYAFLYPECERPGGESFQLKLLAWGGPNDAVS